MSTETNEHDVALGSAIERWKVLRTVAEYLTLAIGILAFTWILATHRTIDVGGCHDACEPRAVREVTRDVCTCTEEHAP